MFSNVLVRGSSLIRRTWRPSGSAWCALALLALTLGTTTGCGVGTAGVVAAVVGNNDSSSTGTVVVALADLQLVGLCSTESSPAIITFRLTDAQSRPATVKIRYTDPTDGQVRDAQLITLNNAIDCSGNMLDLNPNLTNLATSPTGIVHTKAWDFGGQLGTMPLVNVIVDIVVVDGGGNPVTVPVTFPPTMTGNEAPQIAAVGLPGVFAAAGEGSGDLAFTISVADSTSDPLNLIVEFLLETSFAMNPDQGWQLAHPAGTEGQPAPAITVPGLASVPPPGAVNSAFVWASAQDLVGVEADVRLRFTVRETHADGPLQAVFITAPLRVDNNAPPAVVINEGPFFLNPDRAGRIPIPFRAFDAEGDRVQVFFQWSTAQGQFPMLPTTLAGLMALSESQRRQLQLATPGAMVVQGPLQVAQGGTTSVLRIPSLFEEDRGVNAADLANQTLQILRRHDRLQTVSDQWNAPPNETIAGVVADEDPTAAWLLLRVGPSWTLTRIVVETGASTAVVSGMGTPWALTHSADRQSLLVVTTDRLNGAVHRVDLPTGGAAPTAQVVAMFPAPAGPDPIRDAVSLDNGSIFITTPTHLARVVLALGSTRLDWLSFQSPWGLAWDPAQAGSLFLAERVEGGFKEGQPPGRVVRIDLASTSIEQLHPFGVFIQPTALAVEANGSRLLVMDAGAGRLYSLDIGGPGGGIVRLVPADGTFPFNGRFEVAAGPSQLRLLAFDDGTAQAVSSLTAAGGIAQARRIVSANATTAELTLESAFDPNVASGAPWRLSLDSEQVTGSAAGATSTFIWDTADIPQGGPLFLRAIPYGGDGGQADLGTEITTSAALPIDGELRPQAALLDGGANVDGARLFDLDRDLRPEVILVNNPSGQIGIYSQPNGFANGLAPNPSITTNGLIPFDVARDRFNNSRNWIVRTDTTANLFASCFSFLDPQSNCQANLSANGIPPRQVRMVDLDRDGDLDVVAIFLDDILRIFLSVSTQAGATPPLLFPDLEFTLNSPVAFDVADLDNDGDLDIATANRGSEDDFGDLSYILLDTVAGVISGTIDPMSPTGTFDDGTGTMSPRDVVIADLNGDGRPDICSANGGPGDFTANVTPFFQRSDGTFALAGSYYMLPAGSTPQDSSLGGPGTLDSFTAIDAADLDGNGGLDLIVADRSPSAGPTLERTVVFYSRDFSAVEGAALDGPLSSFFARSEREPSHGFIDLADANGDGRLDLLTGSNTTLKGTPTRGAQLYLSRIGGSYANAADERLLGSGGTAQQSPLAVADFDGNGSLDLVSANLTGSSASLSIFRQESPGVFESQIDLFLGSATVPRDIATGDLNQDGRFDIVVATTLLEVYLQPAGGFVTESMPTFTLASPSLAEASGVDLADVDGNGSLDIISCHADSNNAAVFYQSGVGGTNAMAFGSFAGGVFQTGTPLLLAGSQTIQPVAVTAGDINGDGRFDLALANRQASQVSLFLQTSPEEFTILNLLVPFQGRIEAGGTLPGPRDIQLADLNHDGLVDVIVANSGQNTDDGVAFGQSSVTIFYQGPMVTFENTVTLGDSQSVRGARAVSPVDVNRDGLLDLVLASYDGAGPGPGNVSVFLQGSGGQFTAQADQVLSVTRPTDLFAGDIDGDGDPDIAVVPFGQSEIQIFFGGR